jgi:hypothetical protein
MIVSDLHDDRLVAEHHDARVQTHGHAGDDGDG